MNATDKQAIAVQQQAAEWSERAAISQEEDLFGGAFAQEQSAFLYQRARTLRDEPEALPAYCK